jgi:hypothetical protein
LLCPIYQIRNKEVFKIYCEIRRIFLVKKKMENKKPISNEDDDNWLYGGGGGGGGEGENEG